MNIFFLDLDPAISAKYHVDKHVTKMCVEYSQLLCSVHWLNGGTAPYRLTHKSHPCTIWTNESLTNYNYLCQLGLKLCKEYTHRYGKRHKSQDVIEWCINNKPNIKDKGFTEPARAMPDEYKTNSAVESYRNYYINAKSNLATWKNRNVPDWFKK